MARDPAALRPIPLPVIHPWAFILGGLGITLLSWLLGATFTNLGPLCFGLALTGVGVSIAWVAVRLREGRWLLADRIETGAMIAAAGMSCLVSYFSTREDWDSGKLFFWALFLVSLVGNALVILPPIGRKVLLSLILLFHFGGMVTAVTSVDPPNNTGPWVSKQLWTYVYRPYLSFLYMTNAYHFYSPDPGPPSLFWFSVNYEDGSRTWVKMPNRESSAVSMQYQRHLALPEHTYSPMPRLPLTQAEIAEVRLRDPSFTPPRGSWEHVYNARSQGSLRLYPATWEEDGKTVTRALPIPMVTERSMAIYVQYREPHDLSKKLIASVGRRIVLTAPKKLDESGKEVPVKSVKMYRVTHLVITPRELAEGVDPLEKTKHLAYFLGEFDAKGELVDKNDPFLYWYLPIVNAPIEFKNFEQPGLVRTPPFAQHGNPASNKTFVLDCVEMHAAGEVSGKKKGN